jgi:hypothetical protein
VVQTGNSLGFAAETFNEVGVDSVFGEKNLQRDIAVEEYVVGKMNLSHATAANAAHQLIAIIDDGGFIRHKTSSRLPVRR